MYYRNQRFSQNRQPQRQGRSSRASRGMNIDVNRLIKKASASDVAAYTPKNTFESFSLTNTVKRNVVERGYTIPTPIQDQAIPEILAGKDLVGIANTGTGKTAAFLLPLIHKVFNDRTQKVLIIAPTRELAIQIEEECRAFGKGMGLFGALCVGGANMYRQISALRRDPPFVIGTPGRLRDLEKQGELNFGRYNNIVLDEVDRMLDLGFIREIQYIVGKLPAKRQSLFFSATIPSSIRDVMNKLLHNPITISIQAQAPSDHVNQDIVRTNGKLKIDILHDLLIKDGFDKVLLFGRTKHGVDKLLRELNERGFRVAAIHGNKRQSHRERALDEFKNNRVQVLLATDIASRGIDVEGITHVINYDLPQSYEDYIHRIGRTGRADKFGTALTFVD